MMKSQDMILGSLDDVFARYYLRSSENCESRIWHGKPLHAYAPLSKLTKTRSTFGSVPRGTLMRQTRKYVTIRSFSYFHSTDGEIAARLHIFFFRFDMTGFTPGRPYSRRRRCLAATPTDCLFFPILRSAGPCVGDFTTQLGQLGMLFRCICLGFEFV